MIELSLRADHPLSVYRSRERGPLPSGETGPNERDRARTVDGPPMFSITIATSPTRQLSVAIVTRSGIHTCWTEETCQKRIYASLTRVDPSPLPRQRSIVESCQRARQRASERGFARSVKHGGRLETREDVEGGL